jgi:hypothetical protein
VASTRSDIGIGDRNHSQRASGRPTPAADGGKYSAKSVRDEAVVGSNRAGIVQVG